MSSIYVNICENDDQGNRSDRCTRMMFELENDDECFLDIECRFIEGIAIKTSWSAFPSRIEIYGHFIKFESVQDWAGNIYWNKYKIPDYYALGLINLVQQQKDFSVSEARTEIANKWNAGENIIATDIDLPENCTPQTVNPAQTKLFEH